MREILAAFILLTCAAHSFAWGPRGHHLVARVAQQRLSKEARGEIRSLLGNDDLVAISTWADEVRSQRPGTARWHFVDIPLASAGFSGQRDCPRPKRSKGDGIGDCVVDRIGYFAGVLANPVAASSSRAEALKFLVHFVADVHQPMHAVGDADAGNHIHISEFGKTQCGSRACNLHLLWDTDILQHPRRPEYRVLADVERLMARERLEARSGGTTESWADESFHLAQQVWLEDGARVDDAYFRRNTPLAEERLALAGIRLAALLNAALSHHANQR